MVVLAGAVAEGHQLGGGVLGKLATQLRVLCRHAVTGRTMTGGTGRNALGSNTTPVDALAQFDQLRIGGCGRRSKLLRGEVGSHVDDVLRLQRRGKGAHDGAGAPGRLAVFGRREVLQLLADVLGVLPSQFGVGGDGAVAIRSVTGGTYVLHRFLAGSEVRFQRCVFLGGLFGQCGAGHEAQCHGGCHACQRAGLQPAAHPCGHSRRSSRFPAITGILHAQLRSHRSCRPHVPLDPTHRS